MVARRLCGAAILGRDGARHGEDAFGGVARWKLPERRLRLCGAAILGREGARHGEGALGGVAR